MDQITIVECPQPCVFELLTLLDHCKACSYAMLQGLIVNPERFRDDENIWRWAILYCALTHDLLDALLTLLPNGRHTRIAIIVRRSLFEYFVRFRYYVRDPEQARVAIESATPSLRLFFEELWDDPTAKLIEDPKFDESLYDLEDDMHKRFEQVVRAVFNHRDATRLYARYFRFPSFIAHGDAAAAIDVFTVENGNGEIHLRSRRPINEIAMNCADFAVEFLYDVSSALPLGLDEWIDTVAAKKGEIARDLGIEIVFNTVRDEKARQVRKRRRRESKKRS